MRYELLYERRVVHDDIPKLGENVKLRMKKAIEEKLGAAPEKFGKPLRRSLKGYRKLRVGDYRVIFRIEGNVVKIFAIQHRSVVYKHVTAWFES